MKSSMHNFGSSPLSRGIHRLIRDGMVRRGIIPALAGNTGTDFAGAAGTPDHPRSRGEYRCGSVVHLCGSGSSPLSRGIPGLRFPGSGSSRIIPALAGNTPPRGEIQTSRPDHPRSRGEYSEAHRDHLHAYGSSPLSRGIRTVSEADPVWAGIIPALAGNTCEPSRRSGSPSDHPRSRGEYQFSVGTHVGALGSSPLSRGIRRVV